MTSDELRRRLDGRTQRHLAETVGASPSIVNHWISGARPIPEKYHGVIRARYPLFNEDPGARDDAVYAAGYMRAIRDMQMGLGRLREDFRVRATAGEPPVVVLDEAV